MHIITLDDEEFPKLLNAWTEGKRVGRIWRKDEIILVTITNQFVVVGPEPEPKKLAIKPVRNIGEAEELAKKILQKERVLGAEIELLSSPHTSPL